MSVSRRARLLVPLLLAACLAGGSARAAGEGWLALGPGARWEYEIHRDDRFQPTRGHPERTFRAGRLQVEYVRPLDGGLHEVREHRREEPLGAGPMPTYETTILVWSSDDALRLHASTRLGEESTRFQPPLRMVAEDVAPGARWKVGDWRMGPLSAPLEAEVVGREDVAIDEARFEDCLRVRYAGAVTGMLPVEGGTARVREGRIERVVWWKQGVGPVREETTADAELELPDGRTASLRTISKLRLVRHQPPQ